MTTISLTFYQRVVLWNMIGSTSAPSLKEASVYLRLMEKIRLTEQEAIDAQFVSEGSQISWKLSVPDYGTREFEFEDSELKALANVLESASPVKVADAEWMEKLIGV